MVGRLKQLAEQGVSIWLDDLSRHRLTSGDLEGLVQAGVTGVTTNPAIFRNALRDSVQYEAQLQKLAHLGIAAADAARILTCSDVRAACDALAPVHEASQGRDGLVSIEVDPAWAHDAHRTIAEAELLWWLVDRPNVMIKIPATTDGLPAVRACLAQGMNVNVTLIFSLERYRQVIENFFAGLEDARRGGQDLSRISSVASFFVSRVDTAVDRLIDAADTERLQPLRGQAAIANAVLAYEAHEQSLQTERWAELAAVGAQPQRPLWASTGVKDPAYEDTRYVVDLVAPGTVNTVPEPTLSAVIDHGEVRGDRIRGRYEKARSVFDGLAAEGIDFEKVTTQLEHEGVTQFQKSWRALIEDLTTVLAGYRSGQ
ncbi:transaldolase [Nocardia sp. NPDC059246]|uniref:transaldolase n=1 Tax=unclassified Nocardia TaxID=2637762 RepID=UPI00367C611A